MKTVNFVAQKVGNCDPVMGLFPDEIANARYNVYGNAIKTMLKPHVNGVYGMMGNVIFVAGPYYDPAMNVVQDVHWIDVTVKNGHWMTKERKEIDIFIIQFMLDNKISMRKWRAPRTSKSESEIKEQKMFNHLQTNSESVIRKSGKCVKQAHKWQAKMSERRGVNTYEAQVYNMVRYGDCSTKKSTFIEGSGICTKGDNRDRRPPMPQFPEKSYKQTKRK